MLRIESLIALLEEYKFLRRSLSGLREAMPDFHEKLKAFYQEKQAYELLQMLVNDEEKMDRKYMIWVQDGELPLIIEYKQYYSKIEYEAISKKTKINNFLNKNKKAPLFT